MKEAKFLFYMSVLTSLYFLFMALDTYYFKFEIIIIGVIREMTTLPLMGAQLVICAWSLYSWLKNRFKLKGYALGTLIVSSFNTAVVLGTFLY